MSGIKKCFETSHGSVDRNTFLSKKVKIKQHLALFSTVIQERGAYIRGGGGGGAITRCIFFPARWAYNRGGL